MSMSMKPPYVIPRERFSDELDDRIERGPTHRSCFPYIHVRSNNIIRNIRGVGGKKMIAY